MQQKQLFGGLWNWLGQIGCNNKELPPPPSDLCRILPFQTTAVQQHWTHSHCSLFYLHIKARGNKKRERRTWRHSEKWFIFKSCDFLHTPSWVVAIVSTRPGPHRLNKVGLSIHHLITNDKLNHIGSHPNLNQFSMDHWRDLNNNYNNHQFLFGN